MSESSTTTNNQNDHQDVENSNMGFFEHLTELRKRLFYCVIAIVIPSIIALSFAPVLFELLRKPLAAIPDHQMIVLSPLEMFVTYLKLGILSGIFMSIPVILWHIWAFVAPGLYKQEKRWIIPFILLGSAFFIGGGAFAYFIVLPMGFEYLIKMVPATVAANYSVANYFSLTIKLLFAFGLVFELPLIMWVLSAAQIINPLRYKGFRQYWVIIAVVLAAILTPPDPLTQLMMAIPLVLFFEIGIIGAQILYKRDNKQ